MRTLVIGGGIAGLAAAHSLVEHGNGGVQVTLVEALPRLGGKIETLRDDGFIIEGGPDVFITTKPAAGALCEALGLGSHVVETRKDTQRTYVVRDGRLHPMPGGLTSFVPTRWSEFVSTRLVSWPGKARMGLEPLVRRDAEPADESMEAFFSHRLGREAYERLVEPMLAGIYAGRGSALGMEATFPQYRRMVREHGSLLRASLAARSAPPPPQPPRGLFASLQGGLGELVSTLEGQLRERGVAINTSTRASALARRDGGGWQASLAREGHSDEQWTGDHVILATPAWATAQLLEPLHPALAAQLRSIRYASTATLSFAFAASAMTRPLDAHGFLIPRVEGCPLLACTWSSSKWAGRAPAHSVLLRVYLGGDGREGDLDVDDATLRQRALHALHELMGFRAEPLRTWIHRWPQAMPQYEVGHQERVRAIERELASLEGLELAGAGYRGLGIPDCITDGQRAARAVLAERAP